MARDERASGNSGSRTRNSLESYLPDTLSILVIGDICLDEFIHGNVSRVAFDQPIPVLKTSRTLYHMGQAGNVAMNLVKLGSDIHVHLLGVVGDDPQGKRIHDLASSTKGIHPHLQIVDGRPTIHKCRVVAQMEHHMLRIDTEVTDHLPSKTEDALLTSMSPILPNVHGIIVSDYAKGTLSPGLIKGIIDLARKSSVPVLIDPKGTDPTRYEGVTILKPNLLELGTLTSLPVDSPTTISVAAEELLKVTRAEAIIVTLGTDGVEIYQQNQPPQRVPAYIAGEDKFDVNGAGDSLLAALALSYCSGSPLLQATRISSIVAGLVVTKPGTAFVERAQFIEALESCRQEHRHPTNKLIEPGPLLSELRQARMRGLRVAFTNGCFDLLHAGHIQYLQDTKATADILIVGLNSDSSIKNLKGPTRPIIEQVQRAQCLSALDSVDFVVIFSEATPTKLIEAIRPDVLVKGGDYTREIVVGYETVESYGGRVEVMPLLEGVSTTAIIEGILQRKQNF
ncbi:Bifunctional protein HldE [Cladobotryum mycophilum]|uniref:D-glycero-beta-D-manno-heptose 1-phosphate adenylyltransferase n=1 Tax=Cladobotryum mycophilum TaxID=491253 RepID=A0ABR0SBY5_9HYPO